ncbi:MAG: adenosylmethionine--8-amino-7-oxononanoate transaminase [bacterium]
MPASPTQPPPLCREEIERLVEADHRCLWHPFTQMREWYGQPCLIIAAGEGCELIDVEGNRYLDGVSSLWANVHGHRRREIDEAVRRQLDRVAHSTLLGLAHPAAIELARELVELAPAGLKRVFYSDNGSTAVEAALKIAYQHWAQQGTESKRTKKQFVSFHNAYHGDTLGAVSVGGVELFHERYRGLLFPVHKVHYPYCYRCHLGLVHPGCGQACLEELEDLLERSGHTLAALIIEPLVQGAAGMITAPPGHLKAVADLCRRYEVLLIADEVAVGFGRTGKLFACEQEGVSPDLMALAKGITGGYLPLAATLTTESVYAAFLGEAAESKAFFHGHTFTGNPLAAAAALASLEVFRKEKTLEALAPKIRHFETRLEAFRKLEHVGDVRQRGFLAGIELVEDRTSKRPYPVEKRVGVEVILEARRRGLVIRPLGDVIVLMPPLVMSLPELDRMLDITFECIDRITAEA